MSISIGSPLYYRRVDRFGDESYTVCYEKFRVHDIIPDESGWWTLRIRNGGATIPVCERLITDRYRGFWSRSCWPQCHTLMDEDTGTLLRTEGYDELPAPESVNQLQIKQLTGDGANATVNHFLNGWYDGRVDHLLGGVTGWKAAFMAYYGDFPIACLVMGRHANPAHDTEERIVIDRIASHPNRPPNTSSWLIAQARNWAKREGYDEIVSYSGVAGNDGTCYAASGFDVVNETIADGAGWTNRNDRAAVVDGESWRRRKWVYRFDGKTPWRDQTGQRTLGDF